MSQLVTLPTWRPTNKVAAMTASNVGGAGALVALASLVGWDLNATQAIALTGVVTTLVNFAAGWFKRDSVPPAS